MGPRPAWVAVAAVVVVAAVVAWWVAVRGEAASGGADDADATVELRVTGGLCPQETFCGSRSRASEGDGTWELVAGGETTTGPVDPTDVERVADWFVDHHAEFTAHPFEGECPTAFDGPETTIVVGAIPTGADAHLADAAFWETTSCQHAWPPDLVEEFLEVWDRAGIPRFDL